MFLFIFRNKANYPHVELMAVNKASAESKLATLGFNQEEFFITNVFCIDYQKLISVCPLKNNNQKEE